MLEKGTRKPIAGAAVQLLRCSHADPFFGCLGYDPLLNLSTDAEGRATLPSGVKADAVKVRHPDYWEKLKEDASTEFLLSPNAWVQIHMKRTGNYSPGSTVNLSAARACNDCGITNFFLNYYQDLGLPADTTFTICVEATETISVSWFVNDPVTPANNRSGAAQPFRLNKFDTLKMAFNY
ncbi:MAG TPA: hypothetical protein VFL47_16445 [Flavisolibacter sp.]|nr:hypothetical protein [Flavisolibacter sp.]